MKLKKLASICLAAAMTISLAACGSSSSSTGSTATAASTLETASEVSAAKAAKGIVEPEQDPANTETTDKNITIGLSSEPSTLCPPATGSTENEACYVYGAITDTLVHKNRKTNEIEPGLATEWNWKDDTHLQFTLRDGVTMTDGSPMTADDVVYTVGVWTNQSKNTDTGRFISSVTKDDDTHVTIEFNTKAPAMLEMLTMTPFGIFSEDEVNAAGGIDKVASNPVIGCGKYKFKSWDRGQKIVLERNDNYWDKDWKGYYKTITLTFTSDAAAREMAVESGDAQVGDKIPVSQAATYTGKDNVQVAVYTFGSVSHLWYNMTDSHETKELAVRQAIDKALDFDALAQVGTAGYGQPALGYFESDSPYYNQTFTKEERAKDTEGAKKILEDAGIATDGSLKLTALGMSDTTPLYTVMQENLREVGIDLEINSVDTATFVQDAFSGDYDLIIVDEYTAERYPTLLCFLQKATIEAGTIIGGPKVTTDEIDSAITQLIEEKDTAKAKEEAGALEQTMKDQMIVSNLYPNTYASVLGKNIKGLALRERGFLDITNFYEG